MGPKPQLRSPRPHLGYLGEAVSQPLLSGQTLHFIFRAVSLAETVLVESENCAHPTPSHRISASTASCRVAESLLCGLAPLKPPLPWKCLARTVGPSICPGDSRGRALSLESRNLGPLSGCISDSACELRTRHFLYWDSGSWSVTRR